MASETGEHRPSPRKAERTEEPPSPRAGIPADVDSLLALEERAFSGDRLSRRSFRRFMTGGRDTLLVLDGPEGIIGYALVIYRSGTALARLYSIAVDPACAGGGLGARLLTAAERAAFAGGSAVMRLEVRPDNAAAIALYGRRGYRQFGLYPDYYEDHSDALRFQKWLLPGRSPVLQGGCSPVPYYAQTTDFTCGPAAMMMAMAGFDPSVDLDRRTELRLWRAATTVFMTSGLGGCEPVGMAVALARRGFGVEVFMNSRDVVLLESVRDPEKREVMTIAQEDFRDQARELEVPVHAEALSREALRGLLEGGAVVLVLVSLYRMLRVRTPHWVVAFAAADGRIFVHDPWVEAERHESPIAAAFLPIPEMEFDRMACYGKSRLRAAVVVRGRRTR